ncbi:maleylacetoacetate isomerase [Crenothrix sp.]|uniref:maleylacetoacetate isomerase n=1 Tax=Crenothrix sp. TaxID=3100433 RepID=UPI00374D91BA
MSVILYSYFRSSAAYRVRIALNLKKIDYEIRPIHLLNNGGEQLTADYLKLNPQGRVPVLVVRNKVLTQSSAIIEYLDEVYPTPALLPANAMARVYVRAVAQIIACDIHPLNNLRVLNYLKGSVSDEFQHNWRKHWINEGLMAIEQLLQKTEYKGQFCYGDKPSIADAFLIPQVYNALRFDCPMQGFPLITAIYENGMRCADFAQAAPENQPDANTNAP